MGAMTPVMFRSVAMPPGDAFNRRKKLAINQANKTELVELD